MLFDGGFVAGAAEPVGGVDPRLELGFVVPDADVGVVDLIVAPDVGSGDLGVGCGDEFDGRWVAGFAAGFGGHCLAVREVRDC